MKAFPLPLHTLLARQLKRTFGNLDAVPEVWREWLTNVNTAYHQADTDRTLLERALDLTSKELLKKNQQLQNEKTSLEAANRLMMGREERVLELKEEINALCKQFGCEPKYRV